MKTRPRPFELYWEIEPILSKWFDSIPIDNNKTVRARHLRERRFRGIAMVAPVEVCEGGIELLVSNGLLQHHQTGDRVAVGEACLAALEQWTTGRGARTMDR